MKKVGLGLGLKNSEKVLFFNYFSKKLKEKTRI
jgi:hypothetical protein